MLTEPGTLRDQTLGGDHEADAGMGGRIRGRRGVLPRKRAPASGEFLWVPGAARVRGRAARTGRAAPARLEGFLRVRGGPEEPRRPGGVPGAPEGTPRGTHYPVLREAPSQVQEAG